MISEDGHVPLASSHCGKQLAQAYQACQESGARSGKVATTVQHRWAEVTLFQFVYSMINTGMGLCILPQEADRLNEGAGSLWVGIYLGVCGAAQLVCPLAGKMSDRHASAFGRRRPFLVAGSAMSMVCLGFLRQASISGWPLTYLVALLVAQISLNVAFSAHNGLPADLYSEKGASPKDSQSRDTAGVVSAFVAMHTFLGSLSAVLVIIATHEMAVYVQYTTFMFMLAVTCAVVCNSADEESTLHLEKAEPITTAEVCGSFMLDPTGDKDFLWVCIGRLFYYVSTSVTVFLYYYIRDTLRINDEAELRIKLASLVIAAQVVGAVISVPAGRSSNILGRKPVIYVACAIMSCTFMMYVWAPLIENSMRWHMILAAGLCYGLGSGIYVSVDYALALDCLPEGKSTAEAFGLWGISGFFGSTAGPVVAGLLLAANQTAAPPGMSGHVSHYTYTGYTTVMLLLGVSMNLFVVAATHFISGTK
mmetsp:Transcript_14995/g.28136  ORF Transcript_14995/g.28136 Transcript_14995/m.28136 type:complete len:478 (+) Transcript_14995:81-1514(+)